MEFLGEGAETQNVNSLFDDERNSNEDDSSSPKGQNDKLKSSDLKKTIERLQSQESKRLSFVAKSSDEKSSRKKSEVWSQFKLVFLDGEKTTIWKCNDCPSLFIYTAGTGNSHMNRHKCNTISEGVVKNGKAASTPKILSFFSKKVPQESVRQLNKDITIGLAKDLQPLYRSETEGFRYMAQKLISFGATFGDQAIDAVMQHRTTLKRVHLPQICAGIQESIKKSLMEAPSYPKFAFTKDMWTEQKNSTDFLSLSVHYIDHDWVLQKKLLGLEEFDGKKTTQNIRSECNRILEPYFENSAMVIENSTSVTDGGSNMVQIFPNREPCQCHKLNLFVEWTFNDKPRPTADEIAKRSAKGKPYHPMKVFKLSTECPQIKASIAGVKELVTHFKRTHLNTKLPFTLKQDVPTRWNSELIMLESYIKSASEIQKLLLGTDSIQKLMFINETLIRELIAFLTPFRECSEILSCDKKPTIQLVALWYHELREHIKIKDEDSNEMKKLKNQAAHSFDKYLIVDDIHYAACILDPRYKSLQFADTESRIRAQKLLEQYINRETTDPRPSQAVIVPSENSNNTVKSHRESRFKKFMDERETNNNEISELSRYMMMPTPPYDEKFDILNFWKESNDFPKLKKVAQWLLAIPAAEATEERVFSDAGYVMKPRATSLNPDTLSETVFIHRNLNTHN